METPTLTHIAAIRIARQVLRDCESTEGRYSEGFTTFSQGSDLWELLTALRGPDVELPNCTAKCATTSVIRWWLGMPLGTTNTGATVLADCAEFAKWRKDHPMGHAEGGGCHFQYHMRRAFQILGLDWNKVNELIP